MNWLTIIDLSVAIDLSTSQLVTKLIKSNIVRYNYK